MCPSFHAEQAEVAEIVADWRDRLSDLDWLRHLNHLTLPRYNSGWQPPHQVLLVEKGQRNKGIGPRVVGLAQIAEKRSQMSIEELHLLYASGDFEEL